ncbi:MAG: hypothetical protein JSS07_09770 [Proteobacteria bacterium]|nr:hypothetical protein [Pseudomonadota bacterium]
MKLLNIEDVHQISGAIYMKDGIYYSITTTADVSPEVANFYSTISEQVEMGLLTPQQAGNKFLTSPYGVDQMLKAMSGIQVTALGVLPLNI